MARGGSPARKQRTAEGRSSAMVFWQGNDEDKGLVSFTGSRRSKLGGCGDRSGCRAASWRWMGLAGVGKEGGGGEMPEIRPGRGYL